MKLPPDQIAWADQEHARAVSLLDALVKGARSDMGRHSAEDDLMGEAEDVALLAIGVREVMLEHPGNEIVVARALALAIYRLANQ